MTGHAAVSSEESVYIIGGYEWNTLSRDIEKSSIMEYKENIWTKVGDLHQARKGHLAIASGSIVMILGGSDGNTQTEE